MNQISLLVSVLLKSAFSVEDGMLYKLRTNLSCGHMDAVVSCHILLFLIALVSPEMGYLEQFPRLRSAKEPFLEQDTSLPSPFLPLRLCNS
jgi:hypothetical protein